MMNTVAGGSPLGQPGQPNGVPQPSAPMFQQPQATTQMQQLASLMAPQAQTGAGAGGVAGGAGAIDPATIAKIMQARQQPNGLLGGATPGAPNWLNAARFGMSGAGGVNPYTYGMGGQPGGGAAPGMTQPTDTAGNLNY